MSILHATDADFEEKVIKAQLLLEEYYKEVDSVPVISK